MDAPVIFRIGLHSAKNAISASRCHAIRGICLA
jgi:hypothetical protein